MSNQNELFVDHEVRIRLLEKIAIGIDQKFLHLEDRMHSNFLWTIGVLFGLFVTIITLFGGIVFTNLA